MKKAVSLLLALILCLSLCACGSDKTTETSTEPTEEVMEGKFGEAIETDILRITLTKAQLAIKLNASSSGTLDQIQSGKTTLSDQYFLPEEYNPQTDAGDAYVAAKGHTYVAIEFKADNLDRASVEFDGPFNGQFITVEYNGEKYNSQTNYGCESENGYKWSRYNSANILLLAGEEMYFRGYIDIPVDANDLNDDFALIFSLPSSSGKATKFRIPVTAEDRASIESQEMPIDEAIYSFLKEEGQTYFTEHMVDYPVLKSDEIKSILEGRRWNIVLKKTIGSWSGAFRFDADGRIQETIPSIGTGYFNDRTWSVKDDTLILDDSDVCRVLKINDNAYLLVMNDLPYAIMN